MPFAHKNVFKIRHRWTLYLLLRKKILLLLNFEKSDEQNQMSSEMRNMSLTTNNASKDNVEKASKPVPNEHEVCD